MIKIGTKFTVCDHDELIDKEWIFDRAADPTRYTNKNFPGNSLTFDMIEKFSGKTLTVTNDTFQPKWYLTEGNNYFWPVAVFLETDMDLNFHVVSNKGYQKCEEGVTPIDGWFICKICGTNLKEIK